MAKRTQVLFINSKQRVAGTPYDFYVNLNDGLLKADKGMYIKMTLAECTINRSWYSIQDGANSFIVRDNNNNDTIITFPVAYYNALDVRTTLRELLVGWTVYYERTTNKFTFTRPINGTTSYKFIFSNQLSEVLGFAQNEEPTFTISSPTITSTIPIRVNAENAVFIHSNLPRAKLSSIDNHNLINKNFKESTVLASIPIESAPFDNIVYSMNVPLFSYDINAIDIHSIRFWITDENENVLQLPYDFSMTFLIEHLPIQKNDPIQNIEDYLKLMVLSNENIISK